MIIGRYTKRNVISKEKRRLNEKKGEFVNIFCFGPMKVHRSKIRRRKGERGGRVIGRDGGKVGSESELLRNGTELRILVFRSLYRKEYFSFGSHAKRGMRVGIGVGIGGVLGRRTSFRLSNDAEKFSCGKFSPVSIRTSLIRTLLRKIKEEREKVRVGVRMRMRMRKRKKENEREERKGRKD